MISLNASFQGDSVAGTVAKPIDSLPAVVDRIVRGFHPLRIILFGSHARGDAASDSDLDLLVVLPEVGDKRAMMIALLKSLRGVGVPVDVIPTDPEEIARRGDTIGTVLRPALREGKVVYERG